MPLTHILLALLVVVIWGGNFIFVKFGLDEFSPLLLCSLRFIFASIPAIFFIKPPAISFKIIALYGIVMFALQFAFIFFGMHVGMTPGMASLIMQAQVFFSMFFAAVVLNEKVYPQQVIGSLLAFFGIGLVAFHLDQNISMLGFICMLCGAASWGCGNLITKKINTTQMLFLVIWGCGAASVPMMIATLVFEKPSSILYSYHHVTWVGITSLLYIVSLSTWLGYGVWNWLISRHHISTIVPFTLLVPVVGMMSSILILKEPFQLWQLFSGFLVISGIYIHLMGFRFFRFKKLRLDDVAT